MNHAALWRAKGDETDGSVTRRSRTLRTGLLGDVREIALRQFSNRSAQRVELTGRHFARPWPPRRARTYTSSEAQLLLLPLSIFQSGPCNSCITEVGSLRSLALILDSWPSFVDQVERRFRSSTKTAETGGRHDLTNPRLTSLSTQA